MPSLMGHAYETGSLFSPSDIKYHEPLSRGTKNLIQTWAGEGARANCNEHALALIFSGLQ